MARDSDDELLKALAVSKDIDESRLLVLIEERQHQVIKRLITLEKKQEDINKLLNRGVGGAATVLFLGGIVGWITAHGNMILQWFRGH